VKRPSVVSNELVFFILTSLLSFDTFALPGAVSQLRTDLEGRQTLLSQQLLEGHQFFFPIECSLQFKSLNNCLGCSFEREQAL
jgi:hypothetical protein